MFRELEFIRSYIDDLLIITKGDCSYHLNKLDQVLQNMKQNGIKCNTEKSLFGQTQMEYLGFWVTLIGIRLLNKKVETIVNMMPPKNITQVREFVDLVNYYMYIWYRRSHLLQPLTALK